MHLYISSSIYRVDALFFWHRVTLNELHGQFPPR
jgi:hypothetical protein